MKKNASFESGLLLGLLLSQNIMQQQLIEVQQENIKLRKQIDEQTPKTPPVEEIRWHMASKGESIEDTLTSTDIETIRTFYEWLIQFGNKHLKPYLNYRVYSEVMNLLTHAATQRLAELEAGAVTKSTEFVQLGFASLGIQEHSPKTIELKSTSVTKRSKKEKIRAAH